MALTPTMMARVRKVFGTKKPTRAAIYFDTLGKIIEMETTPFGWITVKLNIYFVPGGRIGMHYTPSAKTYKQFSCYGLSAVGLEFGFPIGTPMQSDGLKNVHRFGLAVALPQHKCTAYCVTGAAATYVLSQYLLRENQVLSYICSNLNTYFTHLPAKDTIGLRVLKSNATMTPFYEGVQGGYGAVMINMTRLFTQLSSIALTDFCNHIGALSPEPITKHLKAELNARLSQALHSKADEFSYGNIPSMFTEEWKATVKKKFPGFLSPHPKGGFCVDPNPKDQKYVSIEFMCSLLVSEAISKTLAMNRIKKVSVTTLKGIIDSFLGTPTYTEIFGNQPSFKLVESHRPSWLSEVTKGVGLLSGKGRLRGNKNKGHSALIHFVLIFVYVYGESLLSQRARHLAAESPVIKALNMTLADPKVMSALTNVAVTLIGSVALQPDQQAAARNDEVQSAATGKARNLFDVPDFVTLCAELNPFSMSVDVMDGGGIRFSPYGQASLGALNPLETHRRAFHAFEDACIETLRTKLRDPKRRWGNYWRFQAQWVEAQRSPSFVVIEEDSIKAGRSVLLQSLHIPTNPLFAENTLVSPGLVHIDELNTGTFNPSAFRAISAGGLDVTSCGNAGTELIAPAVVFNAERDGLVYSIDGASSQIFTSLIDLIGENAISVTPAEKYEARGKETSAQRENTARSSMFNNMRAVAASRLIGYMKSSKSPLYIPHIKRYQDKFPLYKKELVTRWFSTTQETSHAIPQYAISLLAATFCAVQCATFIPNIIKPGESGGGSLNADLEGALLARDLPDVPTSTPGQGALPAVALPAVALPH